jgi:hypothetical protein
MSFDLHLEHFIDRESATADRVGVAAVLARTSFDGPDKFGFYRVMVGEVHLAFQAAGLEREQKFTGCAFHLRGFDLPVFEFVYAIAQAGPFVIFNAQGKDTAQSPVVVLTSNNEDGALPSSIRAQYRHRMSCADARQLAELLGSSCDEWGVFRDQVVAGP